jgi:plasmid stabilization system protein ParE
MNVEFSKQAHTRIEEIVHFIASDKPGAARQWAEGLRQVVTKLTTFPYIGRKVPEFADEHLRELLYGEYRVVYVIDTSSGKIVIITIHHAKQLL